MLGSSSIKSHVNSSQSIDCKPRVFIEINNNDAGEPFFYGTGTQTNTTLSQISKTLSKVGSTPTNTDASSRGVVTSLSSGNATLLKTNQSTSEQVESSWTTETASGERSVKFQMFLKSDYEHQAAAGDTACMEAFDVLLVAQGLDSSGKIVVSETVIKNVRVDSISWQPVSISFANPDQYATVDKVRLTISLSPPALSKAALLVGQLVCSPISDYEVYSENRLPISQLFSMSRPGEFLVDISGSLEPTPPTKPTVKGVSQQCTPTHMATYYALGPKYEALQRSITPHPSTVYTYYVSGSQSDSQKIWAYYKNKVKTNKIVLKFNTVAVKPSGVNVSVLTSSGWTSVASATAVSSDGTLILYYGGANWTTTKWSSTAYPKLSTNYANAGDVVISSQTGYQEIWGIKVEPSGLTTSSTDFTGLTPRLEIIEISPRFEVDLTNLVTSVSTISEASSESLLNIGGVSSNSYNITLSSFPMIKNLSDTASDSTKDIRPVSNISSGSIFQNLLSRGAKVKGGYDIDTSYRGIGVAEGKTYVQSFVGYIDKWKEQNDSITINAFDSIKNLQSINAVPLYLESKRVTECIYSVLDSVGFGEVFGEELFNLRLLAGENNSLISFSQNEKLKYFWTSNDDQVSTVLNDLCRIYQISMYTDEYGAVRFKSLYDYSKDYNDLTKATSPIQPDLYVQDASDNNTKSNLQTVDIEENEKPSTVTVKYRTPRPALTQPRVPRSKKDRKPNQFISQSPSTDRVWVLQEEGFIVPYIQLTGRGIETSSQTTISYDPSLTSVFMRAVPFSSHLLIDQEIVSYNGLEYEFNYKTPSGFTFRYFQSVESAEELEMIRSDIFTNRSGQNISFRQSGKLMNVQRGLFGTVASPHTRKTSSSVPPWSMTKFNFSDEYSNGTPSTKFTSTLNGINVTSTSKNEMLYLYPKNDSSDANLMREKRKLLCQFKLGDIPSQNEGYVGVGVGIKIENNKVVGGLLVWVGVETENKKQNPTVYIEQIKSDGKIETLVAKDQFKYSDRVIEEDENIEIYIALNEQRNMCKVLIGGSTAFEKVISKKEDGKKKEIKQQSFSIRQLSGNSSFGFIANGFGRATMGQFLFGESDRFTDMNNINLSLVDSPYSNKKIPTSTYFIGSNNLLDTIVDGRNVTGLSSLSKHNFVYTGAPVARGIQIFDVEYDKFPITEQPIAKWTGYTYDSNSFEAGNLIAENK